MKLSEFKENLKDKLIIIKAVSVYTFQQETAYWVNTWAHVLSTFFYTLSMILFIDVLYTNVNLVAGYSINEMLLFLLVGQSTYYISWLVYSNISNLITDVNNGNLDLILVKPISSLFYILFRKINVFGVLRDSLPPLLLIILKIDWGVFSFTPANLISGIIIALMGIVISLTFHLIMSLPVFWIGESSNIVEFSSHLEYNVGKIIPLEGYQQNYRFLFSSAIPFLISTGISTSVMLGKSNSIIMLVGSLTVMILILNMRKLAWNKALKAYTSASS